MDKLSPKLFYVLKNYTKEQFFKDVISGIIVAIIALPLSIALALASGVEPQVGIYTAITAGFIISFLGGSRVQIAGPTAAFATIVAGIVAGKRYGRTGCCHDYGGHYPYYNGILPVGKSDKIHPIHHHNRFYGWYCRYHLYWSDKGFPWS